MTDYLTRVAEAVRDAVLNETVDMASTRGFLIECIFDLPKIIASVPRPEPVAWIIDWPEAPELGHYLAEEPSPAGRSRGLYAEPVAAQSAVPVIPAEKFPPLDQSWSANTEYIAGWNACRDAMLAAVPEAPQPDDDDFELTCPEPPARDDHKSRWNLIRAVNSICDQSPGMDPEEFSRWLAGGGMLELLESGRKWLKLEKEIATLREQNAALVAALEHMVNDCESLEFDGAPSSAVLNKAVYALASAKSGAE